MKILVTRADGIGFPGYIKSIKKSKDLNAEIIGVSHETNAIGFNFVDHHYIVPKVIEKPEEYVQEILKICVIEKIDILLPVDGNETIHFAKNKSLFDKINTKIITSNLCSLIESSDKHKTYSICESIGIPTPKYVAVKNFVQFKKGLEELGYPNTKICFKPSISSGSRGFRVLLLPNKDRVNEFFTEQADNSISVDEFKQIVGDNNFPELLLMEFLPGEEISVDVLADNGKALVIVPRVREKVIGGASYVGRTVFDEEIIKFSKVITAKFNLDNIVGIQFKKDEIGVSKIIEINARTHGGLIISILSGANLLELGIKKNMGIGFDQPIIKWNNYVYRYIDDFSGV